MNVYCVWWLAYTGLPLAPCLMPGLLTQSPVPPGMVWWPPGRPWARAGLLQARRDGVEEEEPPRPPTSPPPPPAGVAEQVPLSTGSATDTPRRP